jgi:hypothetical protein
MLSLNAFILTKQRYGKICLSKTHHLPCNGYSRHIKVVSNVLVSHFSLNHTHRSLMVILEEPWSMLSLNAFILTKQRYGKIPKVNFPSHERVCDDQIRHQK